MGITSAQTDQNHCPSLNASNPTSFVNPETQKAWVVMDKELEKNQLSYEWTIYGGKILTGQNTKTITFIWEDDELTIQAEIKGLPTRCGSIFSAIAVIDRPPEGKLFDEYGKIPRSEERIKVDRFFSELNKDLSAQALIRLKDDKNLKPHINFLNRYIKLKKYGSERVLFLIGGDKDQHTQLIILYAGSNLPECKNCVTKRAVEFEKAKN
jgi:hypothetical protein